jgi:DNA-binding transcriptional LysR family regulator
MEIHQLKTFVMVAREGSITRASERLHLSQPAVSAHIKAIEDTLGLVLFERTARGMTLTPDGERMLAKAERTLGAHRDLLDEAMRLKGGVTGTLRLGASGTASTELVSRLLVRLDERHPDVELVLQQGRSLEILDGLRDGTLDAGFYNEAGAPDPALATLEVGRFDVLVASAPGLVARPLDWSVIAKHAWIGPATSTCCGAAAERLFAAHGVRPARFVHVDREDVTRTLIAGGVGLGLLHADAAKAAQASGEVELVHEEEAPVRVLFAHLASRANDPLIVAARAALG